MIARKLVFLESEVELHINKVVVIDSLSRTFVYTCIFYVQLQVLREQIVGSYFI